METNAKLTKTQMKVAELMCVGFSEKEAADALHVSARTISNHKQNILHKLGFNKTTEMAAWYWCNKLNQEFDLAELKKKAIAATFALLLLPSTFDFDHQLLRSRNTRSGRARIENKSNFS